MSDSNNTNRGGIDFSGALTIAFIVLKLVGVIEWSWLWVLSPIWISLVIVIIHSIILIILETRSKSKKVRRNNYDRYRD